MADFTFTSPDGKDYTVSGPDGATKEQAFGILQQHIKNGDAKADAPPAPPGGGLSWGDSVKAAGHDVLGAAETAGTAVANLPHAALSGANDLYQRYKSALPSQPDYDPKHDDPSWIKATEVENGAAGKDFTNSAKDAITNAVGVGHLPGDVTPSGDPHEADGFGQNHLVNDVIGNTAHVGADVGAMAAVPPTLKAARAVMGASADAADSAINAAIPRDPAKDARVGANQQLVQARADGFKATANDVRSKTNPADATDLNADLPGPSRSSPDTTDQINTHNQSRATQTMAADVGLPNTRNINPKEIEARLDQEGQTYGKVGDAIGNGRQPTPALDHDIAAAGERAADPEVQAKIDKRVQFYRDQLKQSFDGPEAVQTVRTLRNDAQGRALSDDPAEQAMGKTHQAIADAIEDEMMRQLPANAQDLREAFPQSRQQMAKLYELAQVSEGGQVNPQKVLQLKDGGKPLTGAAAAVANAAEVLPESMSKPGGAPATVTSVPHAQGLWRDVWNAGKAAVHKIPGMNPATDAYQASRYGAEGGLNATPPASVGPNVSELRDVELQQPPGQVGNEVPQQGTFREGSRGLPLPQAGAPLSLEPPPGVAEEAARQRNLDLGPPSKPTPGVSKELGAGMGASSKSKPAGKPGEPGDPIIRSEWERAALDRLLANPDVRVKKRGD